ncbi:beta-phosphoglucomutase [Agrilactobacillus composti DSM 18527 = JCM 14202]|uniref:Beta-phosphoglucomutase n=2 Tax=Agrilactobacillus TaxID=2767875 RepID=A0A0R1XZ57_9LACO|nr:beta-phosphoglucomutase [Agrilactobacillus composti DSM 18527 = JCM 14202]
MTMKFTDVKGFAFDLDGVITDTARFHGQAWRQTADKVGTPWTQDLADSLRGISRMASLELILKAGGHENDYSQAEKEKLAQQKNDRYQALIATLTPDDILPGISDFLAELQREHYKMAIASASKNAPLILDKLGLANKFVGVVDPNTLHHGKPDPEIFVKSAELLGLPVAQVAGVEDAVAGIAAINGAGEFSIGIGDADLLSAADVVFRDTSRLTLENIKFKAQLKD